MLFTYDILLTLLDYVSSIFHLELLGYTFLLFFQEVPKNHFRREMDRRASSGHETSTKLHEISTRIHWKRPRRLKIGFGGKKRLNFFLTA